MTFSRNTKHLTIFKVTEILTLFSADMPTWVNFISCNSKNRGKIQIVTYMTTYVRLERYGGPCRNQSWNEILAPSGGRTHKYAYWSLTYR